jgi:hypothetical protein
MAAFDVAGLPDPGQQAFVQSNGSVWTLTTDTIGVPDGITIVAATGGGPNAQWVRENVSAYEPLYLVQPDWFVNPATGNDEASGAVIGSALKTKAEVFRRWGYTWTPDLKVPVTIHYVTADTSAGDPSLFAPTCHAGAFITERAEALPAPSFTGTLLAVTAKSHAGNTALKSTFTPATGAVVTKMLLVNATRGNSRALAVRDTGAGNWLIAQPLTPYVSGFPSSTFVDTWANGDAITGYVLQVCNMSHIGGIQGAFSAGFDPMHIVENLNVVDLQSGFGPVLFDAGFGALENVVSSRPVQASGVGSLIVENTYFANALESLGVLSLAGGVIGPPSSGSSLQTNPSFSALSETILEGNMTAQNVSMGVGFVYVDTGAEWDVVGVGRCFAGAGFYGPGILNVASGVLNVTDPAVTSLPITTIRLNGETTAYSSATSAGLTTTHGGIGLTAANIDAAAGATGFGGYAYGSGASIIVNSAQP